MPRTRLTLVLAAVVATVAMAANTAEANCGLDYCPLPEDARAKPSLGRVQLVMRHVEFSLPDGAGSYLENLLRIEVQRFENWNFGAWVAPIMLTVDDDTRRGFSNPVFFVERRHSLRQRWRVLAGFQLEVPMGDSHNGIASGHSELLSYAGVAYERTRVNIQIQGGWATSLRKGHAHAGDNVVYVNPHADQEAQVRASLLVPLMDGALLPGVYFNGRMVIGDVADGGDRTFLTGALGTSYQVTEAARLQAQLEVPITSPQRFDWRAGVGIAYSL